MLELAIELHKDGNLQEAERLFSVILQSQPVHPDANHNLGLIAVSANKIEAALPLLKNAFEAAPRGDRFLSSYVDGLIRDNQLDKAEEAITQGFNNGTAENILKALNQKLGSVKQNPIPAQSDIDRLLGLYKNGRELEAEELSSIILEGFPNHGLCWKILGALFGQTGRLREVLSANKKVVELMDKDADAHFNLGMTLLQLVRVEEVEASYRQAIALNPDFTEAYCELAFALEGQGKFGDAEENYRKTITLQANYPQAHYSLSSLLKGQGRLEEAELSIRNGIAFTPNNAAAHYNLGIIQKDLGRLEQAESNYRRAIFLNPDFPQAHNNLGNILKQSGRLDEAEANYKKAIDLSVDDLASHLNLANVLLEKGKFDEAILSYKIVLQIDPDHVSALYHFSALNGERPLSAPRAYVENLFDEFAFKFDKSLVNDLEYKIPQFIAELIIKNYQSKSLGSVLDLGCGTGLTGAEIKKYCTYLEGIDVSAQMLEQANKEMSMIN